MLIHAMILASVLGQQYTLPPRYHKSAGSENRPSFKRSRPTALPPDYVGEEEISGYLRREIFDAVAAGDRWAAAVAYRAHPSGAVGESTIKDWQARQHSRAEFEQVLKEAAHKQISDAYNISITTLVHIRDDPKTARSFPRESRVFEMGPNVTPEEAGTRMGTRFDPHKVWLSSSQARTYGYVNPPIPKPPFIGPPSPPRRANRLRDQLLQDPRSAPVEAAQPGRKAR